MQKDKNLELVHSASLPSTPAKPSSELPQFFYTMCGSQHRGRKATGWAVAEGTQVSTLDSRVSLACGPKRPLYKGYFFRQMVLTCILTAFCHGVGESRPPI